MYLRVLALDRDDSRVWQPRLDAADVREILDRKQSRKALASAKLRQVPPRFPVFPKSRIRKSFSALALLPDFQKLCTLLDLCV